MNNVSLGSSFQLTSGGFKEKEGRERPDYFLVVDVSILRPYREEIVPVSQESSGVFSSPAIVTTRAMKITMTLLITTALFQEINGGKDNNAFVCRWNVENLKASEISTRCLKTMKIVES